MKYIGANISKDTSILKTMHNMLNNNGNALQIFVSSPMNSSLPDINKISSEAKNIKTYLAENNFKLIDKNFNRVTKFLNFKNFDKQYKDIDMYDLFFKKI